MISIVLNTGEKFNYTPGNASAPYLFSLFQDTEQNTENTLFENIRDAIYNILNTSQSNSMSLTREAEINSMIQDGNKGEYISDEGSSGRKHILSTRMHIGHNIIIC